MCVRAEQTANYSFAKEYIVQSTIGSISNQRRQQILRSPSRTLRSLPMNDCHFGYVSRLTKKETLGCWELDFFMLSTQTHAFILLDCAVHTY
jgi:hypothetical protein